MQALRRNPGNDGVGNDGFVQFVCEDQAEDAIEALDMSTFKSNVLAVRNDKNYT